MNISDRTQSFFNRVLDTNQNGVSKQELKKLDSDGDGKVDASFRGEIAAEDLSLVEEALTRVKDFQLKDDEIVFPQRSVQGATQALGGAGATAALPDFGAARTAIGAELASTLDIAHTMTDGQYGSTVQSAPGKRAQSGYFAQIQDRLGDQGKRLDALIGKAKAQQPQDTVEIARLQQLKEVVWQCQDLYARLSVSHNKDRFGDAAAVIEHIAAVQTALGELAPESIGAANHEKITQQLQDYTAVALSFPALAGKGEADTVMDVFSLQTYQRLRQILGIAKDGHRVRESETKDIQGALTSFKNDVSDMRTFLQRFRQLEADLASGKFADQAAYRAAMRAAVPGTSQAFQASVDTLAQAKWSANLADQQRKAAAASYTQAQTHAQNAFGELQAARKDLEQSTGQIGLSQDALKQANVGGAREAKDQADGFQRSADVHLKKYQELRQLGAAKADEAEAHRSLAMKYVNAAASLNELVKQGPYARQLKPETERLDGRLQELRTWSAQLQDDLGALRENLTKMDGYHKELQAWSQGLAGDIQRLDSGIKLEELRQKTQQMAKGGIDNAHGRIAQLMQGYELSPNAKLYLQDPAKVPENERANVREELSALFAEHPGLARAVAKEMSSLRSEFAAQRQELLKLFGANSAQVKALDLTEQQLVEGWMQKDGLLVEALIAAGNESKEVQSALAETMGWIKDVQGRFLSHLHGDKELSAEAVKGFNTWMQQQPEMKARYDEVVTDYGQPVATVPMSLMVDKTGRAMTFSAYVFKDGDTYKVLNPLDQRIYSGSSQKEALAALASESRMADGELRYHDGESQRFQKMSAPTDTFWADVGMGTVGVVGTVLLLAPEPTTLTKWGGGAMMGASGAYFAAKGTAKLVDLYQHETIGLNAETGGALLDLASGVLVFARGGGLLAATARGSESAITQTFLRIGQSARLSAAEYATFAAGASLGGYQFYHGVINNPSLSDSEKLTQGAKLALAVALPLAMAPATRLGMKLLNKSPETVPVADVKAAHQAYSQKFGELEAMIGAFKKGAAPETLGVLHQQLKTVLAEARAVYESPAMKRQPGLQEEGLQRLNALEAELGKLPPLPLKPALDAADLAKIQDIKGELVGDAAKVQEFPAPKNAPEGTRGKRQIESEIQVPPGKTKEEARALGIEKLKQVIAELEAKGLKAKETKPNQFDIFDSAGKLVKRVAFEAKESGQIKIQDLVHNYTEIASIRSAEVKPVTTRTSSNETATAWNQEPNRAAGIPSPAELSRSKGTDSLNIEDFRNIAGLSIEELVARVPKDATLRELRPLEDGASAGFEYSWKTVNADGLPTTMRLRIHGPDKAAPAGSNAAAGWVAVVEKGGLRYDGLGYPQSSSKLKPNFANGDPNPAYDPKLANDTHIPIKGNPLAPPRVKPAPVWPNVPGQSDPADKPLPETPPVQQP